METLKKAFYATIGSGELAAEKGREVLDRARTLATDDRPDLRGAFEDLAKRGERVVNRIQRSKPAKRAADGTKQATRQVKGAITSIQKAVGAKEQPAKSSSSRKTG
jgi:hypothetical protein